MCVCDGEDEDENRRQKTELGWVRGCVESETAPAQVFSTPPTEDPPSPSSSSSARIPQRVTLRRSAPSTGTSHMTRTQTHSQMFGITISSAHGSAGWVCIFTDATHGGEYHHHHLSRADQKGGKHRQQHIAIYEVLFSAAETEQRYHPRVVNRSASFQYRHLLLSTHPP